MRPALFALATWRWFALPSPATHHRPTEFVSDDLRPRFADLVWKVRLAGRAGTRRGAAPSTGDAPGDRWLHLVVLLEFQSTVDWMMAARVQDYAARLWLDMHRREPFGPGLQEDNGVAWLARVESAGGDSELFAALDGLFGWMDDAADGTLGAAFLDWMWALTESRRLLEAEEFEMAVQAAAGGKRLKGHWTERVYRDRMRRMAQARAEGREEGKEFGLARGEALGLERERALLSRLVSRRFGADAARRLAAALERADHEGLVEIGDWIADAENADQLLERCADGA